MDSGVELSHVFSHLRSSVTSFGFRFDDTELFPHWRGFHILTVVGVLDAGILEMSVPSKCGLSPA